MVTDERRTKLCILFDGLLLSDLEPFGPGGGKVVVVLVGHCQPRYCVYMLVYMCLDGVVMEWFVYCLDGWRGGSTGE